ncbi:alpha-aminoadipic semialdehyde synthase, mitochondrial-like [Dendronephthya gigantea]|uniref:alpha-aminoadipic semialdehyde synthase, mitochondrial-like n=1 Tax=Dendronephthya gigantea TaxID=151771 RepID=UPI00106A75DC|nr:alpha-aminoadipic semialdehyde synthase, mitochondrial-like [Dendronephthya gigantea]
MWGVGKIRKLRLLSAIGVPKRSISTSLKTCEKVMAIRREDINVWERRAPISPAHVKDLVDNGIKVLVQPSTRRAYTMAEYEGAGAVITEDLSPASLIVGVKAVPINQLLPDKTYAFFSHTIKAQPGNMPLLDAMLVKNIRLVDYERMLDSKGQRVAAFGKFAGVAGMINILHGLGLRLLALGHHTPFMYMGGTHNYKNSRAAKLAIFELGEDIAMGKLPAHFGPLSFVFTGSGNVSQGAQEMFQELPHMYVPPQELKQAVEKGDHRKLIGTVIRREDYLVPKAGGKFDAEEYDAYPEKYRSIFAEKIAPYMSVMVNGVYWQPGFPRLLTNEDIQHLTKHKTSYSVSDGCPPLPHRFLAVCDISADINGSLEFMTECTTIEYPFELFDPQENKSEIGMAGDGILICSIDNLPAQLPREATDYFGKLLLPWIPEMVESDTKSPFDDQTHFSETVRNAVITSNGKLTKNYEYIEDLRKGQEPVQPVIQTVKEPTTAPIGTKDIDIKHRVLLLGSGLVSGPVVEYLMRDQSIRLTIASVEPEEAAALSDAYANASSVSIDVQNEQNKLNKLVGDHELVISLLPYSFHHDVAQMCIQHKVNLVTASYVSPDLKGLHQSAVDAGITILNEVGLDPGIDHMTAMECFDEVNDNGGKVVSFMSYCGGLPAPELADNPLRMKFSWSPRGVLSTTQNGAKYLENGEVKEIPAGEILHHVKPTDLIPGYNLECYPNRDSTVYKDIYGLPDLHTMIRGTLRYRGYADVCIGLQNLGLLSVEEKSLTSQPVTWINYLSTMIGCSSSKAELYEKVFKLVGEDEKRFSAIKRLGLLSNEIVVPKPSPLDTLSQHLSEKLPFENGERDLVLLRHEVGIEWPDNKKETRRISLIAYGDSKYSAMSRTVGFPAGIGAKMVLGGKVKSKGVVIPSMREIYQPILQSLSEEGITPEVVSFYD